MRRLKIGPFYLISIMIILILGTFSLEIMKKARKEDDLDLQLASSERMEMAEAYLKGKIAERGIEIEDTDLNRTGLIGPEFSKLTTTPGDEKAKRSSLNPLFAAAMIRYFKMAGLEKGDTVSIGASGSFPGFVIAVLTAAEQMGLKSEIIASLGSSMHGANRVEYNIFDIILDLMDGGFSSCRLLAVSPGGSDDKGGSVLEGILYEGTRELSIKLCQKAAMRAGCEVILEDDIEIGILRRLNLYSSDAKLFVNIGGASVNSGLSSYSLNFPQGLVLDPPKIPQSPKRGLNYEYAERGIPVLNLLNVKLLCSENGIPFDPVPFSSSQDVEKPLVFEYNKLIALLTIMAVFSLVIYGFLKRRREE